MPTTAATTSPKTVPQLCREDQNRKMRKRPFNFETMQHVPTNTPKLFITLVTRILGSRLCDGPLVDSQKPQACEADISEFRGLRG